MARQPVRVAAIDLTAHVGLRGVAAVWVMMYHAFENSKLRIDLQGSAIVPLFILLSGFNFAVCYGGQAWKSRNWFQLQQSDEHLHVVNGMEMLNDGLPCFDTWALMKRRFARVGPMYYFACLLGAPMQLLGWGYICPRDTFHQVASVISSLTFTSPTLLYFFGPVIASPGWTVCTLMGMWLFAGKWLAHAQRMSDEQLVSAIRKCHLLQFVFCWLTVPLEKHFGYWRAFGFCTQHPLTRAPVFLMGLYAGLLAVRHEGAAIPFLEGNPWGMWQPLASADNLNACETGNWHYSKWHQKNARLTTQYLLVSVAVTLLDYMVQLATGDVEQGVGGQIWFQALVAIPQLHLVLGLTRDRGVSWIAKLLRRPVVQRLGQWSMGIYLVHFLVMQYMAWLRNGGGRLLCPRPWSCSGIGEAYFHQVCVAQTFKDYRDAWLQPVWCSALVPLISIPLAAVLHQCLVPKSSHKA
mmetsp:Transcript_2065/g.3480  ORF Transcript_2065/g.3480 Transcript_2065/m.3480 type:complete len:465 (+) Transcript_2065:117-1511(+)